SVCVTSVFVDAASCRVACAPGNAASGATYGFDRGHVAAGVRLPEIQLRRASAEQVDGSAVRTLCPTPGTTTRWPCGKRATTAAASDVGVRRSRPPLNASTGTSGSAAGTGGTSETGVGQSVH